MQPLGLRVPIVNRPLGSGIDQEGFAGAVSESPADLNRPCSRAKPRCFKIDKRQALMRGLSGRQGRSPIIGASAPSPIDAGLRIFFEVDDAAVIFARIGRPANFINRSAQIVRLTAGEPIKCNGGANDDQSGHYACSRAHPGPFLPFTAARLTAEQESLPPAGPSVQSRAAAQAAAHRFSASDGRAPPQIVTLRPPLSGQKAAALAQYDYSAVNARLDPKARQAQSPANKTHRLNKVELAISSSANPALAPVDSGARGFAAAVASLRQLCEDDLELVNKAIVGAMHSQTPMIGDIAGHLINAGGKRLRPILTLSAARLFGFSGEEHIKLAAAVELIHGATLLHDDVVDASSLRRGASTANMIWGNKESVLVGDFLFSQAFELMVSAGSLRVLQILSRAAGVIAEGEVLQLATQKNLEATFEMYLAVVESKTAALFAAAAQAGAVIAGADHRGEEAMRSFGRNLGIAYQLVDDALDYSGREKALGKSVGDDFREGKMTLPVVYALDRATLADRDFWRRTIADGDQRPEDFETARRLIISTRALEDTFACARRYAARAVEDLSRAPANDYSVALGDLAAISASRIS